VTVSASEGDEGVELIVSDDGTGLPEEDLARASTRFWRAENDGAGTGLGLAIAAEITAGHGGTVAIERAPEGGLLVRYTLPRGEYP
jgi:signal transduction histidine kinase